MRFPRARRRGSVVRFVRVALVVVVLAATTTLGLTAANTVPGSKAANKLSTVGAEQLKPALCNGITLTKVVTGSGTIIGSASNELILGSSAVDTITGLGGNDCLLGGASVDSLDGGTGTDVCISGSGMADTFISCETTG